MPRFVLLDHSLRGFAGHHDLYARQLLGAARAAGFTTYLVAHRRYPAERAELPGVSILTPFEHTTYGRYTLDAQAPSTPAAWLGPLGAAWRAAMRERRMDAFAAGCAAWSREIPLEADDVVFAATVSELDFAGLSRFLAADERARRARWHAQFHWSPFRPGDRQRSAEAVRRVLRDALAAPGPMRLHLHCPTEPLAREYGRLEVAPFGALPYPVDGALSPREARPYGAPLSIVNLGHPRREKGRDLAPRLVRELWDDGLASGRARLVVQARAGTRIPLPGPAAAGAEPVVLLPPFLPRERYLDLVRDADLGLLLYDRERYLTRCSGVLLELLAAGVPVVVPGGCWLADQVEEPAQAYLSRRAARGAPLPLGATFRGDLAVGAEPLAIEAALPGPGDVMLGLCWAELPPPGTYLRVVWRASPGGAAGVSICAPRERDRTTWVLARPGQAATALRLELSDAYGGERLLLRDLSLLSLGPAAGEPSSAVGLIAAESSCAPALAREALAHVAHYRASAVAHSRSVRERHAPAAVLAALLAAP